MTVRPLHDRLIVRRIDEGEQKVGGIIIPDTAKEKPQQGTVIAAGNGKVKDDRKRISLDVKAGDRILFGKYAGQEIKLEGEEYLILKEDDRRPHQEEARRHQRQDQEEEVTALAAEQDKRRPPSRREYTGCRPIWFIAKRFTWPYFNCGKTASSKVGVRTATITCIPLAACIAAR
jgi:chaperonin GroES